MAAFSSVPPAQGAPLPERASEYLALSFGDAARTAAAAWLGQGTPAARRRHITAAEADAGALAALASHLAGAAVGLRVLLAGTQSQVYRAAAAAKEAGLIEEELSLAVIEEAVIGDSAKHVYCPHCGTTTPSREPIGATPLCGGCRRRLEIYPHFSRRTASYLGFMADAEKPLPPSSSPESASPEPEAVR
ncbi:hypothetical protein GCM10023081_13550 [Arthrobacter ginkgonis]|uniref:Dimethylamine monooxygenase subunit DmmA-like C-terminal domain-containing protein n=1 Tax=Arthrobacter ginkgonis TaxID=1630594 RepID=A0ABP7C3T8_9MICC